MKNIVVIIFIAIPFFLFIQSCADASQNAEMMKKEMEKITETVDEKLEILTDSLNMVCADKVDSIALMRISNAARSGVGGSGNANNPTSTTGTPKTSTPKETAQQTKKDKMSGNSKTVTESDTKDKKDKMQGNQKEVTTDDTDKKKSKMKGGGK